MNEEQWNSAGNFALLMYKMHIHLFKAIYHDLGLELGQFIQFRFLEFPVEAISPVSC